jgi:hypothetical protein
MQSNVVNRIKFDFTCRTEAVAGTLQRELKNFTVPGIEAVLSQLLQEQANTPDLVIEQITIELGNIGLADLNSAEVLDSFRTAVLHRILASRAQVLESEMQLNGGVWMIAKEYLLTGDIPWWVEKEREPDMNTLLQRAMLETPQQVRSFMARFGKSSTIRQRIWSQLSSANIKQLLESEAILADTWVKAVDGGHQDIFEFLMKTAKGSINDAFRVLLFKTVFQNEGMLESILKRTTSWFNQEKSLNVQEVGFRGEFLNSNQQALKNLSLQQLIFLLEIEKGANKNTPKASGARISAAKKKLINSISKMPGCESPGFLQELTKYNTSQLVRFENTLNQFEKSNILKHKMVKVLVSDPDFFRRDLLRLAEKVLAWSAWSAPKVSGNGDEAGESSRYQFICSILPQVCQYQEEESTLLSRRLKKLPDNFLQLLAGLACLDKDIFNEIASTVEVTASEGSNLKPLADQFIDADQKKFILENAGLVLLAPYLPRLFAIVGYLEGNTFKNTDYQIRAMYLIRYIFDRTHTCPEYSLQLNKILCGIALERVVPWNKRRLNKKERREADDVVSSAINNWKALRNTSSDGFRAAFLKRKGLLTQHEAHWALQVEKKTYDVLLPELPWSFSFIKLPWMDKPIEVEW